MKQRGVWSISFANDGGPLIVLPRELLGDWHGAADKPDDFSFSDDDDAELTFKDDYERACDTAYPAALVKVGSGVGLVIGAQEHAYPVQWLKLPEERGIYLVGWHYGRRDSSPRLVEHLRASKPSWRRFRRRVRLISGDLILLHAASSGTEVCEYDPHGKGRGERFVCIGDAIPTRLDKGRYTIESTAIGGELGRDPFGCVVCRWKPVEE
jgi:hypothetical protein